MDSVQAFHIRKPNFRSSLIRSGQQLARPDVHANYKPECAQKVVACYVRIMVNEKGLDARLFSGLSIGIFGNFCPTKTRGVRIFTNSPSINFKLTSKTTMILHIAYWARLLGNITRQDRYKQSLHTCLTGLQAYK